LGPSGYFHASAKSTRLRVSMAAPPLPRIRVPHPHVRCEASVLGGSPHVVGSRVPVRRLWAWHRGGASVETLVKRYPNLGSARILDALAFAYDNPELIEADVAREQALIEKHGVPTGARPLAQLSLPFNVGPEVAAKAAEPPPAASPKAAGKSVGGGTPSRRKR